MRLNEMWTAPQVAGFMIKPYKSCYILYFFKLLSFSCVEHAEVNRSAPFYLSPIVCHLLFIIWLQKWCFFVWETMWRGFRWNHWEKTLSQKQRELNSLRKSGKNNDLAINSIVYIAKSLVSNVSMKHLSYISNNPNTRWSMTPLHFWDNINNVWENSTWE